MRKSVRTKEFTARFAWLEGAKVGAMMRGGGMTLAFSMPSMLRRSLGRFLLETADQMEHDPAPANFPILILMDKGGELTLAVPEGKTTEEDE